MQYYCVNKNAQKKHKVHQDNCHCSPNTENQIPLKSTSEIDAINEAIQLTNYLFIDGCFFCCRSSFTKE